MVHPVNMVTNLYKCKKCMTMVKITHPDTEYEVECPICGVSMSWEERQKT